MNTYPNPRKSVRTYGAWAAALAGAFLLIWGAFQPGDKGRVQGWESVNTQVASALVTPSASEAASAGARSKTAPVTNAGGSAPDATALTAQESPGQASAGTAGPAVPSGAVNSVTAIDRAAASSVTNVPHSATSAGEAGSATEQGKLNLNAATLAQLDDLPGIGPAKAKAIIDYRDAHGGFKTIDELRKVKGIGAKLMEKIRPFVAAG